MDDQEKATEHEAIGEITPELKSIWVRLFCDTLK